MFLKIFLWFWLATALVSGVAIVFTWTVGNEPFLQTRRMFTGDRLNLYADSISEIYENSGKRGVTDFFSRGSKKNAVVYDSNWQVLAGEEITEGRVLAEKALQSGKSEFEIQNERTLAAQKLNFSNGEYLLLVIENTRIRPQMLFGDWNTTILRWSVLILTAGLVCYGLARYFSSPLVKMREATKKLADGDLTVRVANKIGRRRDELAYLACDFDNMAERIENLVSSQKRLTRDISHELRSPLARLDVALELARHKTNKETEPILERIQLESKRLNELISQILLLAKLESGEENIEKIKLNLTNLINEIVSDANFEAKAKGKSVEFSATKDPCYIYGNDRLTRSAIENVVRNGVKYAEKQVKVSLTNGCDVTINVHDDGKGLAEQDLEKIFQPFFRVGEARERSTGGTGLGLAITKQAVQLQKGVIFAENAKDGGLNVQIKFSNESAEEKI
jgi:two-component system sensor histidine kinase CpxA